MAAGAGVWGAGTAIHAALPSNGKPKPSSGYHPKFFMTFVNPGAILDNLGSGIWSRKPAFGVYLNVLIGRRGIMRKISTIKIHD